MHKFCLFKNAVRRVTKIDWNLLASTLMVLVCTAIPASVTASDIEPETLLIYYGWPSSINSTFTVPLAAAEFGQYDYVVLGAGLESGSHPDHTNTVNILADPAMANTTVFGYIDLGVTTNNYTIPEIESRVDQWITTGVDGIFFDDFGYDFGTSRTRQNAAVVYVHGKGMPVIANAFNPDDAFSNDVDATYNSGGTSTFLNSSDFYLFESHQIRIGVFESEATWQDKANLLATHQQAIGYGGFGIMSITTNDAANTFNQDKFFYAWHSALLYGHTATGWGEYLFSSSSAQAPFRSRPATDCGTVFSSAVVDSSPIFSRITDQKNVFVNTSTHAYGCSAVPLGFVETQVVDSSSGTGAAGPTAVAYEPGTDNLFVLEKGSGSSGGSARVRIRNAISGTVSTGLNLACVDTRGERGLLGIAFSPDYLDPGGMDRYVYLFYTRHFDPSPNPCFKAGASLVTRIRVSRFTESSGSLSTEEIILDGPYLNNAINHNGGAIRFAPDKTLFIAIGDNDTDSDANPLSRDMSDLRGIIISNGDKKGFIRCESDCTAVVVGCTGKVGAIQSDYLVG